MKTSQKRSSQKVYLIVLTLLLGLISVTWLQSVNLKASRFERSFGKTPSVFFEKNSGQFPKEARYKVKGMSGHTAFVTKDGIVAVTSEKFSHDKLRSPNIDQPDRKVKRTAVAIDFFSNSNLWDLNETDPLSNKTNYFKGHKDDWVTGVQNFGRVKFSHRDTGGTLELTEGSQGLEMQLIGIDAKLFSNSSLALKVRGSDELRIGENGELIVDTGQGPIKINAPVLKEGIGDGAFEYKTRLRIGEDNVVNISPTRDLVRPKSEPESFGSIWYSTYLGGSEYDGAFWVNETSDNAMIVAGVTISSGFPTTMGTYDTQYSAGQDIFVSKIDGNQLVFSTFIGGGGLDTFGDAAFFGNDLVLVGSAGIDAVDPFPTTLTAFDSSHNGSGDAYVTVLNESGASLEYSTFIGGSDLDQATGVAVDSDLGIYVVGKTSFTPPGVIYPTTTDVFQTAISGQEDAFLTKINISLAQALEFSTFLGGGGIEQSVKVLIGSDKKPIVVGSTASNGVLDSFPTTTGAFDRTVSGFDAFVSKFNTTGTALEFSTVVGGSGDEFVSAAQFLPNGSIVIGGMSGTTDSSFPTTPNAYDSTPNGVFDGFLTAVLQDGAALEFSTFLGGTTDDTIHDLVVAPDEQIIVVGETKGDFPNYPNTIPAPYPGGASSGFLTRFNPGATQLRASTHYGGGALDAVTAVSLTSQNHIYIAGVTAEVTSGINFPVTNNAYDNSHNGGIDAYASEISLALGAPRTKFDFDGDARADYSIFRRAQSEWWNLRSTDNSNRAFSFGTMFDIPVPADYTGDGLTDQAFFRPAIGSWFVLRSDGTGFYSFPFGAGGDVPAPADYDNDGIVDPAVFRPSTGTWFIRRSRDGDTDFLNFGSDGDFPLIGDYDGDGQVDIGVYKRTVAQFWIFRSNLGLIAYQFGAVGDFAFAADMSGDGTDDIGVFRPSTGFWFILRSEDQGFYGFPFGANGDIPAPADYDGDGTADPTVFRPSDATWYSQQSRDGAVFTPFGATGDEPVPASYVYKP